MAAIDFPNSPTLNQEFTANGRTWIWSGTVWSAKPVDTSVSRYDVQDTAPTSPTSGDVWFNSTNARTYVYYDSAWVESNPSLQGTQGATGTNGIDANTNLLINGGMDIWQRGEYATLSGAGGYIADRFTASSGGGGVMSWSKQAFAAGQTDVPGNPVYFARLNYTTSGTNDLIWEHHVEDVRTLAGQVATWSFYAKVSSGTKTITPRIVQNFGTGGSTQALVSLSDITLTTSWQRFTLTTTIPSISGKTVGANSYLRLDLFYTTSGVLTYDLANFQLEAGSIATPFKRAGGTIQAELAACQRYYYRTGNGSNGSYSFIGFGPAYDGTNCNIMVNFPVQMRTAASSIDLSAYSTYLFENSGSYNTNTPTSVTLHTGLSNPNCGTLNIQKSGSFNTGFSYKMMAYNNATAYVGFNAEL